MIARALAKSLETLSCEFQAAEGVLDSPLPACCCCLCFARKQPVHFLVAWQMAFQTSLGLTDSALNRVFVSRKLACHAFGEKKIGFCERLSESVGSEGFTVTNVQKYGNQIRMRFEAKFFGWETFEVEFVLVDSPKDLIDLWDQQSISIWASLSYCPKSQSYSLERKPFPEMTHDALPQLDLKVWNSSKESDVKQLLFLLELSCVLDQDFSCNLSRKISEAKETMLLDCSAKEDLEFYSRQLLRLASCEQSLNRLVQNKHLLQLHTENEKTESTDQSQLDLVANLQDPDQRVLALFYLCNGIQKPAEDEADCDLQTKIYRNFELLFPQNDLWDSFVASFSPKNQGYFQDVRLAVDLLQGLSTASSSENFLGHGDDSLDSIEDLEEFQV